MYHKKNLKQDILDYAISLLNQEGIDSLSMRKIAQALEVSPTALYRHYENIRDLQQEMLLLESKIMADTIFHSKKRDPRDRLVDAGHAFISYAITKPQAFNFLLIQNDIHVSLSDPNSTLYPLLTQFQELIREFKNDYDIQLSETILFIHLWGFILGYSMILRTEATEYTPSIITDFIAQYTPIKETL